MLEKKIYLNWSGTENEAEKWNRNLEICCELKRKYKVKHFLHNEVADNYDIIFEKGPGSKHFVTDTWRIVKNTTDLSDDELALLADYGVLAYGYRREGDTIIIYNTNEK